MAQFELGLAHAKLGESVDAIAAFLSAVDFNPGFMEVWYELGNSPILFDNGDVGTNLIASEEPFKRTLHLKESEAALRAGRFDMAERLLRELLGAHPAERRAIKLLADTLLFTGRRADAEALLAQCLVLAPNFLAARFPLRHRAHRHIRLRGGAPTDRGAFALRSCQRAFPLFESDLIRQGRCV